MTIAEMSIRELSLSGEGLEKNDIIRIRDKKRKKTRGIFVSQRYSTSVEKFLVKKMAQEKKERQKNIKKFMSFAGMMSGAFGEQTIQEIKGNMKI